MKKEGKKREGLIKCPVCGIKYWVHALNGHITNMASREAVKRIAFMINHSNMKSYTFSPIIVMRQCPHWKYRRKNKILKMGTILDSR